MVVFNINHVMRGVVVGIIVIFFVVLTKAFLTLNVNQSPCKVSDSDARPILFKRLSDEKNFPFNESAGPPSEHPKSPDYETYLSAISRFPDVKACLMDSEREKQIPDLTRFDWNKITEHHDSEVCLFRIFSSIGSIDGSRLWLENQGFDDVSIRPDLVRPGGTYLPLEGFWDSKKCGQRYVIRQHWSHWIDVLTYPLLGHKPPIGVEATFTAEGEVKYTQSAFTSM